MHLSRYFLVLSLCVGALTACGSDAATSMPSTSAGDAQTPPTTNGTAVEAWLTAGSYKTWTCETASHPQMKVSPHGINRICSNDLISNFTGAVGAERPKGSAAVKELYDDSMALVGYAVSVKVADTSRGGANWYWYERVPQDSMAPHDANGIVADGIGLTPEKTDAGKGICVGCHSGAGSDTEMHLVNKSGDFVYDVIE
ncbi:MAG: hypothetical protein ABI488_14915 [Polyangiaceae bacterium]